MRAIVIKQYGGPEVLQIEDRPDPQPEPGTVVIEVKAFGVNHAETYMRLGTWPEIAEISGIECVGIVKADPSGRLAPGQKVVAFMGGMGRSIGGSYAEFTRAPASNVLPVETALPWDEFAAIPESYATAWACLYGNLKLEPGQTILIRGATSALGRAAVNIAAHAGAQVIATTRSERRVAALREIGAKEVLIEKPDMSSELRGQRPAGIDAVLDLVGNSTVLDSLCMARVDGRVCEAGWLGGLAPIADFNPIAQLPSRVHLSLFGSFVFGTPDFPLSEIPMQTIVDRVASGAYQAKPAKVFSFEQIREAHRLMDSGAAGGKIVVKL
ncbi:MAG TPA: zinc-binding dehydrogenase [Candidatus Cybelea sp.]|nr:zinc-binding dehydrogenase [Candidatus Cybelea sp.]